MDTSLTLDQLHDCAKYFSWKHKFVGLRNRIFVPNQNCLIMALTLETTFRYALEIEFQTEFGKELQEYFDCWKYFGWAIKNTNTEIKGTLPYNFKNDQFIASYCTDTDFFPLYEREHLELCVLSHLLYYQIELLNNW